jgi:hypothetical protein
MNNTKIIVVCHHYELYKIKPLFPEPAKVVTEGARMMGQRASVVLVTRNVNTNSDWFKYDVGVRLVPGGKVLRIDA